MKRIEFVFSVLALVFGFFACTKIDDAPQNPLLGVTLNIVPDYNDGSVKNYNPYTNCMFLSIEVTPSIFAEELADTSRFNYKAVFSPVLTKGRFGEAFTITPKDISYNQGAPIPYLDLCLEFDEMSAFMLQNEAFAVSCTIEDKSGLHGVSTSFVPLFSKTSSGSGEGSGSGGEEDKLTTPLIRE